MWYTPLVLGNSSSIPNPEKRDYAQAVALRPCLVTCIPALRTPHTRTTDSVLSRRRGSYVLALVRCAHLLCVCGTKRKALGAQRSPASWKRLLVRLSETGPTDPETLPGPL